MNLPGTVRWAIFKNDTMRIFYTVVCCFALYSAMAQKTRGWSAPQEAVERLSKERSGFNFLEEHVPAYVLPDILTNSSGKKITTPDEWEIWRRVLLSLFRESIYGRAPATAYIQNFSVMNEVKNAMDGAATLKQVEISIYYRKTGIALWILQTT